MTVLPLSSIRLHIMQRVAPYANSLMRSAPDVVQGVQ